MIAYIKGKLTFKSPTEVIIEANGIGYRIYITDNTYRQISKLTETELLTHFIVKEDSHSLYGFAESDELSMFEHLISVSGVGPSIARGMLSSMAPKEIRAAIIAENDDPRSGNLDQIKNAGLIIRIHDLMIPEGSQGWGPIDVEDWVEWIRVESLDLTPEIKPKHWVHIRDTTDAVSLLVMADTDAFAQGVIDLCGRRAWTPDAVISEINLVL